MPIQATPRHRQQAQPAQPNAAMTNGEQSYMRTWEAQASKAIPDYSPLWLKLENEWRTSGWRTLPDNYIVVASSESLCLCVCFYRNLIQDTQAFSGRHDRSKGWTDIAYSPANLELTQVETNPFLSCPELPCGWLTIRRMSFPSTGAASSVQREVVFDHILATVR